jgi:hypothetical protein
MQEEKKYEKEGKEEQSLEDNSLVLSNPQVGSRNPIFTNICGCLCFMGIGLSLYLLFTADDPKWYNLLGLGLTPIPFLVGLSWNFSKVLRHKMTPQSNWNKLIFSPEGIIIQGKFYDPITIDPGRISKLHLIIYNEPDRVTKSGRSIDRYDSSYFEIFSHIYCYNGEEYKLSAIYKTSDFFENKEKYNQLFHFIQENYQITPTEPTLEETMQELKGTPKYYWYYIGFILLILLSAIVLIILP